MEASDQPRHGWQSPLWTQVGAPVTSGLILVVVVGLVSDLSFGEVLLYIGLPLLVVVVVVVGALAIRRAVRAVRELKAWQRSVSVVIGELGAQVRRLHLADVIHTAEGRGWTVRDEDDALVFFSPEADEYPVRELAPLPEEVAEGLEFLAPEHFDAKTIPFIARVGSDAAVARKTGELLEERTIPELKQWAFQQSARAALAYVSAEAKANGWEVHWAEESVRYLRRDKMATVSYDEIDIGRLRKALGLRWINL